MAGVMRGFGEATEAAHQFFTTELASLSHCSSLHQSRQCRPAGNGWNAAFGKKANFGDETVLNSQRQFQNIPASRIFNLGRCVGIGDFSGVSRVLKMVEDLDRVHRKNCSKRDVASYVSKGLR